MKPSLVDFNIHPAKKEVRFKDISEAHHAISTAVRNFYRSTSTIEDAYSDANDSQKSFFAAEDEPDYAPQNAPSGSTLGNYATGGFATDSFAADDTSGDTAPSNFSGGFTTGSSASTGYGSDYSQTSAHTYPKKYPDKFSFPHTAFQSPVISIPRAETEPEEASISGADSASNSYAENPPARSFRYLGQVFSVFLIVEKDGELYLIDQHAAHERYLFDRFMEKAGLKQHLLIPYKIATESEDDDKYIESIAEELDKAGFAIKKADNWWEISTVPQKWQGTEEYIRKAILEERKAPAEIIRTIAAYSSCRAAVMEGDYLDRDTAEDIIEKAFQLPDPHCPHGRPVWIRMTKESLYQLVKRT